MRFQPKASHFIDGEFVESKVGKVIDVIYPATGEVIAKLHSATPDVVERALASSKFAQGQWSKFTGAERGRVLRRAAEILRSKNDEISELETHDTGKPIQETLVVDAMSGADALEYYGGLAASLTGEYIPLANGDFAYTSPEPLGICVGIGAWNYPIQIACLKAAPALACGNSMIFKPSEMTPLSALRLAEIFVEAGAPNGLFNVVQGFGDVGSALVSDKRVAKVSLTGSVATGRKVYAAAADGMKYATMELGGKSPLIIFDDASMENAVSGAIVGNFFSSGQVCSNGTRVFVQKGVKTAFLDRLLSRLTSIRIGDPMDPTVNFGPLVSERQLNIVKDFIATGIREGARLVYGGTQLDRPGFFLHPTVFAEVTDEMTIARDEIFGPVMSILDFEYEDEVVTRANSTDFGLAAGVFTSDVTRAHRVAKRLQAGTCYINTYNVAPVEAPFGGSKLSGVGRENSKLALQYYTEMKTTYVSVNDLEAPY